MPTDRIEKMRFVLSQAQLELDSTVSAIDSLTAKAFTLLAVSIPLIAGLFGFALSQLPEFSALSSGALAYAAALGFCSWHLWKCVFGTPTFHSGNIPKNLLAGTVLEAPLEKIIYGEVRNYADYIRQNQLLLKQKASSLRNGMHLFLLALLTGAIVLIVHSTLQLVIPGPEKHGPARLPTAVAGFSPTLRLRNNRPRPG